MDLRLQLSTERFAICLRQAPQTVKRLPTMPELLFGLGRKGALLPVPALLSLLM
jgi:hypothetical protein